MHLIPLGDRSQTQQTNFYLRLRVYCPKWTENAYNSTWAPLGISRNPIGTVKILVLFFCQRSPRIPISFQSFLSKKKMRACWRVLSTPTPSINHRNISLPITTAKLRSQASLVRTSDLLLWLCPWPARIKLSASWARRAAPANNKKRMRLFLLSKQIIIQQNLWKSTPWLSTDFQLACRR